MTTDRNLPKWAAEIADEAGNLPAYAWPGGYPLVYLADDGETLCAECVNTQEPIHFDGDADGWRVEGYDVFYEGPDDQCAHCYKSIPSAYGDPDATDEES
jgi:hypothetical protein